MRLLNVNTLQFQEFSTDRCPPYIVTSHRWTGDEATYKDVLKPRNQGSRGFRKIVDLCAFVRRHGGGSGDKWIWIDTCCINQNSSAEVSESINSMWRWYVNSAHCIAYLHDVRPLDAGWDAVLYDFRRSEWFERGWTLQELLAPACVIFLNRNYEVIGRKSAGHHNCPVAEKWLNQIVAQVSGIPLDVLSGVDGWRDVVGTDTKFAWAANRRTTRSEDAAYCLLGIFDIYLPLIYGEGERNARKRLEQEIAKRTMEQEELHDPLDDQSLQDRRGDSSGQHDFSIPSDDLCPICHNLLLDPVTMPCSHIVCETCIVTDADERVHMTILPLDSEGVARGDAASENFRETQRCPKCGSVSVDALRALPNADLTRALRSRHPQLYAERAAALRETDESSHILEIQTGNWHELDGPSRHRWTFFVKPSRTDIIQAVHIHLHETFKHPYVVLEKPPYSYHGQGWGYFTIDVRVVLQAGYAWVSSDAVDGPDGAVKAALKLQWTLDFASFGGRGAMGRCRVKVQKERKGGRVGQTHQVTPPVGTGGIVNDPGAQRQSSFAPAGTGGIVNDPRAQSQSSFAPPGGR